MFHVAYQVKIPFCAGVLGFPNCAQNPRALNVRNIRNKDIKAFGSTIDPFRSKKNMHHLFDAKFLNLNIMYSEIPRIGWIADECELEGATFCRIVVAEIIPRRPMTEI